jgi:hypothetical protein
MGVVRSPWLDRRNGHNGASLAKVVATATSGNLIGKECTRKLATLNISALTTSHCEL